MALRMCAKVRLKFSPTLAGVVITVALSPPVCVIGLQVCQQVLSSLGATHNPVLDNLLGDYFSSLSHAHAQLEATLLLKARGWMLAFTAVSTA